MTPPPLKSPIGSPEWLLWLSQIGAIVDGMQQSGTTADRPTKGLYIGRRYFDTDLGRPIYLQSYTAGVAVWAFSSGVAA